MSTQVQGTLLDVLKKKMRQTKEEMEKYKDECDEYQKRLQVEVLRREEVSGPFFLLFDYSSCLSGLKIVYILRRHFAFFFLRLSNFFPANTHVWTDSSITIQKFE